MAEQGKCRSLKTEDAAGEDCPGTLTKLDNIAIGDAA